LLDLPIGAEVEIDGVEGHNHLPQRRQIQFTWIADAIGCSVYEHRKRKLKRKNLQNKVTLIYITKNQEESVSLLKSSQEYSKENQLFEFIPIISEVNSISSDLIKQIPEAQNSYFVITGEQAFRDSSVQDFKRGSS